MSFIIQSKDGLGQPRLDPDGSGPGERQRRRAGELGSRFVGMAGVRVHTRCKCQKALFAAIAQNCGREGLHIMTVPMTLVHEGCGTGRIAVVGADDDLRKALAIASDGVYRGQSRALSLAPRAGVGLKTRVECGFRHLRPATDRPGPGEQQRRRGGELRGWRVRV